MRPYHLSDPSFDPTGAGLPFDKRDLYAALSDAAKARLWLSHLRRVNGVYPTERALSEAAGVSAATAKRALYGQRGA